MSDQKSVGELFEMAIAAERAAEELYRRLGQMFAHHSQATAFWQRYAIEEAGHAKMLKYLRDRLTPEQLAQPAEASMLQKAHRTLELSIDNLLSKIKNLEDAYQLASELENSETNAVCEFLIDNFAADEKTQIFLRAQLRDHVGHLIADLPVQLRGVANRQAVKVIE